MIYTRSLGIILRPAIHLTPGDTIRAYRAPILKFFVPKTANLSIQLRWAVIQTNLSGFKGDLVCVLLLVNDLSLSKSTSVR